MLQVMPLKSKYIRVSTYPLAQLGGAHAPSHSPPSYKRTCRQARTHAQTRTYRAKAKQKGDETNLEHAYVQGAQHSSDWQSRHIYKHKM